MREVAETSLFRVGQSHTTVVPKNATLLPLLLKRGGGHLRMESGTGNTERKREGRGMKEMQQVEGIDSFLEWLKKLLGL